MSQGWCWGLEMAHLWSHRERHLDSQASILHILSSSPRAGLGSRARGRGVWEVAESCLEVPQLASLAVFTVVRPQCLPGGPGHQRMLEIGRSRTSLTSDSGQGCSHAAHPAERRVHALGVPGASLAGLDSPSPVWGGPGLRRGRAPDCSGGGQMESGWRPWGRGCAWAWGACFCGIPYSASAGRFKGIFN